MDRKQVPAWGEPEGLFEGRPPRPRRKDRRPAAERLQALVENPPILTYPRAEHVKAEILAHMQRPRMGGLLLAGPRSNGRTTLAQSILDMFPMDQGWLLDLPTRLRHEEFWIAVIRNARTHIRVQGLGTFEREMAAHDALRAAADNRLKLVFVDVADHLMDLSVKQRRIMMHCIARCERLTKVPFVPIVTPKLASSILADRDNVGHYDVVLLPQWTLDADYLDMLDRWEDMLPLQRPSGLAQRELAMHLYALSGGLFGVLAAILMKATATALLNGEEQITIELLDALGFEVPATFKGFLF